MLQSHQLSLAIINRNRTIGSNSIICLKLFRTIQGIEFTTKGQLTATNWIHNNNISTSTVVQSLTSNMKKKSMRMTLQLSSTFAMSTTAKSSSTETRLSRQIKRGSKLKQTRMRSTQSLKLPKLSQMISLALKLAKLLAQSLSDFSIKNWSSKRTRKSPA